MANCKWLDRLRKAAWVMVWTCPKTHKQLTSIQIVYDCNEQDCPDYEPEGADTETH